MQSGEAERDQIGPAAPRPAATLVLLRESPAGIEALLLRRPPSTYIDSEAWVFPGGVLDARDDDAGVIARLDGPSPEWWGQRLDLPPGHAAGFVSAAVRETFEETGILLASRVRRDVAAARAALLGGTVSWPALLKQIDARLNASALTYFAHWITPEAHPRRYDTRFFLTLVPKGARCDPNLAEFTTGCWMTPAKALEGAATGAMRLLPPTHSALEQLLPFRTAREAADALAGLPVHPVMPRVVRDADGTEGVEVAEAPPNAQGRSRVSSADAPDAPA